MPFTSPFFQWHYKLCGFWLETSSWLHNVQRLLGEQKEKQRTDILQTLLSWKYPEFAVSDQGSTDTGFEILHPLVHRNKTVTQPATKVASARGLFSSKHQNEGKINEYTHEHHHKCSHYGSACLKVLERPAYDSLSQATPVLWKDQGFPSPTSRLHGILKWFWLISPCQTFGLYYIYLYCSHFNPKGQK